MLRLPLVLALVATVPLAALAAVPAALPEGSLRTSMEAHARAPLDGASWATVELPRGSGVLASLHGGLPRLEAVATEPATRAVGGVADCLNLNPLYFPWANPKAGPFAVAPNVFCSHAFLAQPFDEVLFAPTGVLSFADALDESGSYLILSCLLPGPATWQAPDPQPSGPGLCAIAWTGPRAPGDYALWDGLMGTLGGALYARYA